MKLFSSTRLALLLISAFMPACKVLEKKPTEPTPAEAAATAEKAKTSSLYEWDDAKIDAATGPLSMTISVDKQRATLYKGEKEVAWTTVATGVWKYPTPAGRFNIMEKVPDKKSNLYGKIYSKSGKCVNSDARNGRDDIPAGGRFEGSRLRYWMRLTGDGVGMHIGSIPRPGHRASHGCIRLPAGVAGKMYARLPMGTPVRVTDSNPPPRRKTQPSKPKPKPKAQAKPSETPNNEPAPAESTKYSPPVLPASEPAAASPSPATEAPAAAPAPAPAVPAVPEMKTPVEAAPAPPAAEPKTP
jgi:lipoprotein-anchoring transpeptidase ErfK/SrfK